MNVGTHRHGKLDSFTAYGVWNRKKIQLNSQKATVQLALMWVCKRSFF